MFQFNVTISVTNYSTGDIIVVVSIFDIQSMIITHHTSYTSLTFLKLIPNFKLKIKTIVHYVCVNVIFLCCVKDMGTPHVHSRAQHVSRTITL